MGGGWGGPAWGRGVQWLKGEGRGPRAGEARAQTEKGSRGARSRAHCCFSRMGALTSLVSSTMHTNLLDAISTI